LTEIKAPALPGAEAWAHVAQEKSMLVPRLAAALALMCTACGAANGSAPPSPPASQGTVEAIERGRRLAADACAACHAIGAVGVSPMADATPFRVIVSRRPLDQLEAGFAEGLVTSHPAMPDLVFRASEIDDLIAYLETVKAEP
jgi:mono/diheme cytochrome c family protein